jgi:hypothetical protein
MNKQLDALKLSNLIQNEINEIETTFKFLRKQRITLEIGMLNSELDGRLYIINKIIEFIKK